MSDMSNNESLIFLIELDDYVKIGNHLKLYDESIGDVKEWEFTDIGVPYPVLLRNNTNSDHFHRIQVVMARVEITPLEE